MTATWNPTAEEREKIRRLEEYQRRERARIDAMLKALAEERERERREREAERDARLKKERRLYRHKCIREEEEFNRQNPNL